MRENAEEIEARVDAVLAAMSLAEKVDLVSNRQGASSAAPQIRLADGAAGIRIDPGAGSADVTALPAPIALAATWDPDEARRYGHVLGRELRATGHHVLLGPAVDIARIPLTGRIFESFGEDPLLASRLVVPEVRELHSVGAQACVKHFLLNNQEAARASIDVRCGERALWELYLPAFSAAIGEADAAAVMGSYNRVDGEFASQSKDLLRGLLRDLLGFDGWIVSDFLANHSLERSWDAGLDWELTDDPEWGDALLGLLESGRFAEEEVDQRIRRILRAYFALGQEAEGPARPVARAEREAHHETARRVAERGAVLLSNDGILPLDPAAVQRVLVVGPDAAGVSAAGGGSPLVAAAGEHSESLLGALRAALPSAEVGWCAGVDPISAGALLPGPDAIPGAAFRTGDGRRGVEVAVWGEDDAKESPIWTGILPSIEVNRGFFSRRGFHAASEGWTGLPDDLPARHRSRWTGAIRVPVTGDYTFALTVLGSARLTVSGETVLVHETARGETPTPRGILWDGLGAEVEQVTLRLEAGGVDFVLDYSTSLPAQSEHYGAQLRLGWVPPEQVVAERVAEACELAAASDLVVVVGRAYESEAMDRPTTRLPQGQHDLVRALVATGTPTVAVTMSGGPIDVTDWDGLAAHLHAWYAGEAQGPALARLLLGDADPSGRLPITFPRGERRTGDYPAGIYPGRDGIVRYDEGVRVGYRDPADPIAYPFGHGLSYARIEIGDLAVDGAGDVTFRARNGSGRAGSEVVQVYLADPDSGAPLRLVGWSRVSVPAWGERRGRVVLDPGSGHLFERWSERGHEWVPLEGTPTLLVGTSSTDIIDRLTRTGSAETDRDPQ